MNASSTSDPRAELERLQSELADRQSPTCFAHAGIALVAALLFAGAAGKLFWDSIRTPLLGIAAAVLALALTTFGVIRYLQGRRRLRDEVARFERLMGLRRALRVDDPDNLLPQR
ncbi:MAG: hypothetical protein IRZ16_17510 [Myxococcaceae bacterium]|nr:hypothetical protein [Myxococcaceae bacterium]